MPSGVTSMPSSVVRVSFSHTSASGSSSLSRLALRSTAAAAASQSRDAWPVLRGREGERALLGLELGGLVQPALDHAVFGHGAHPRSSQHPS